MKRSKARRALRTAQATSAPQAEIRRLRKVWRRVKGQGR